MHAHDDPAWMADLAHPFAPEDVLFRVGQTSRAGDKATLLAYMDARMVMDRLDRVVGPGCWSDRYDRLADGSWVCTLSVLLDVGGEPTWVSKQDAAPSTDIEGVKGGVSDAFKRAAVKWGIGRYLYRLPSRWRPVIDGWCPDRSSYVKRGGKPAHVLWPSPVNFPEWAKP